MVLLVFLIERFIHTTYTITADGRLVISSGRFSKSKMIWLKDITSVVNRKSVSVLNLSMLHYIMIGYGGGRYVSLLPLKELEFVTLLEDRRKELNKSCGSEIKS